MNQRGDGGAFSLDIMGAAAVFEQGGQSLVTAGKVAARRMRLRTLLGQRAAGFLKFGQQPAKGRCLRLDGGNGRRQQHRRTRCLQRSARTDKDRFARRLAHMGQRAERRRHARTPDHVFLFKIGLLDLKTAQIVLKRIDLAFDIANIGSRLHQPALQRRARIVFAGMRGQAHQKCEGEDNIAHHSL